MVNRIKGMYDILPPESQLWSMAQTAFLDLAARYGYAEVRTPILERTELFARSIGETTDIVEKEMYSFKDRSDRGLTLRPEGTASMVRAYIENKIANTDSVAKWVYSGPMYRYERPQKGRNRQFFQVGAEAFGVAAAEQDAELIEMGWRFMQDIGIGSIELELNSLGDREERQAYRSSLVSYLDAHRDSLCKDCLRRMESNPMRVLDCKQAACSEIAEDAPMILDGLGQDSRGHFDRVCFCLQQMDVPFTVNRRIVRGLDYYNRTAFEFKTRELGAQDALGGGGRYDGLVKSMGGPNTPAVGFALGLDRIILLLEKQEIENSGLDAYFIPIGASAILLCQKLAIGLRKEGLSAEVDVSGRRLKHLFARAERKNAACAIIMGDNEIERGIVNVKDLKSKQQREIKIDELTAQKLR